MGVGVEVEPQSRAAIWPEEPGELAGVVLVVEGLTEAGPGFLRQLERPIRVVVEARVQRMAR